jgi:hypothetical protein
MELHRLPARIVSGTAVGLTAVVDSAVTRAGLSAGKRAVGAT